MMSWKAIMACTIVWIGYIAGFNSTALAGDPAGAGLQSTDEAIARASLYTGFEQCDWYSADSITCKAIDTIANDKTPFIDDLINNHPIWKVTYRGIEVGKGEHTSTRNFDVILDRASGKLLSIYSFDRKVGMDSLCEEPDAGKSENSWSGIKSIRLAETPPVVKFWEALNQTVFNPARIKILRAMYVDVGKEDDTTGCIWIIIARCSEVPIVASSGGNSYVYSIMIGIDGSTGRWMFFTNAPGDLDREER